MKHKFYPECSLFVVKDDTGERLLKLECQENKFRPVSVDFIIDAQKFIKVYSEYNLIVTPTKLFTLDGKLIEQGNFPQIQTVSCTNAILLIILGASANIVNEVLLWNGKKVIWRCVPQDLLYTDKYIGVYQGKYWKVYDTNGKLLTPDYKPTSSIRIEGDMLISDMLGYHDVYSLKDKKMVLQNQQLVKVSSWENFAIGINMQRVANIWCKGEYVNLKNVEFIELLDEAGIFYIRHNHQKGYDVCLFTNPDRPFIKNAEIVSFDEISRNFIIVKDGIIREYKSAHA